MTAKLMNKQEAIRRTYYEYCILIMHTIFAIFHLLTGWLWRPILTAIIGFVEYFFLGVKEYYPVVKKDFSGLYDAFLILKKIRTELIFHTEDDEEFKWFELLSWATMSIIETKKRQNGDFLQ